MTKTLFVALLLLSVAHVAAPPATAVPYPPHLDLSKKVWKDIVKPHPNSFSLENDSNGSLYFDWAASDPSCVSGTCTSMHYLWTTHVPQSISGGLVITLNVQTGTPTPVFHFFGADCGTPSSVRALIWAHNNDYSSPNSRWWATDVYYVLGPGTVTMVIPLDPHRFSNVDGHLGDENDQTLAGWNSAIADVSSLGVTFGGGCNYGHGIYVLGGTATFTLQDCDVVQDCPTVSPCPGISPTGDCARGRETGATSAGVSQCVQSDGTLLDCGSQSVNVITTACKRAACCLDVPPTCTCVSFCGGGSYLECR